MSGDVEPKKRALGERTKEQLTPEKVQVVAGSAVFPIILAKGPSQFVFLFFSNRTLLGHEEKLQCGCHRGCNVAALDRENPRRKEITEEASHKDRQR